MKQKIHSITYVAVLSHLSWIKSWGHNQIIHIVDINQDSSPGLHSVNGLKGVGRGHGCYSRLEDVKETL